jgi:hypothetical protein
MWCNETGFAAIIQTNYAHWDHCYNFIIIFNKYFTMTEVIDFSYLRPPADCLQINHTCNYMGGNSLELLKFYGK